MLTETGVSVILPEQQEIFERDAWSSWDLFDPLRKWKTSRDRLEPSNVVARQGGPGARSSEAGELTDAVMQPVNLHWTKPCSLDRRVDCSTQSRPATPTLQLFRDQSFINLPGTAVTVLHQITLLASGFRQAVTVCCLDDASKNGCVYFVKAAIAGDESTACASGWRSIFLKPMWIELLSHDPRRNEHHCQIALVRPIAAPRRAHTLSILRQASASAGKRFSTGRFCAAACP
jgi:hypothetical protein